MPTWSSLRRVRSFTVAAVDTSNRTLTLDKPLEYDVPVDSTSDGSAPISGSVYASKAAPLVDPVVGVGFEDFALTHEIPGLDPADATHNYGNMAPAEEMHGIVFEWAADSWVRGIRTRRGDAPPGHLAVVPNGCGHGVAEQRLRPRRRGRVRHQGHVHFQVP